jgi:hypothetical protein
MDLPAAAGRYPQDHEDQQDHEQEFDNPHQFGRAPKAINRTRTKTASRRKKLTIPYGSGMAGPFVEGYLVLANREW